MSTNDTMVHVRVPASVLAQIDDLALQMSLPGAPRTRASVVRWLVTEGAPRELAALRAKPGRGR